MAGGKKSSKEKKKRRRSNSSEVGAQGERKRRSTEFSQTQEDVETPAVPAVCKEEEAEEPSDIEEGGLDLNVPLKPISFYISDKKEMLQQCFRVVGEKKLQKMLPDLLKDCSIDEIKQLCQEQLEMLSEKRLLKILDGEPGTDSATEEEGDGHMEKNREDPISQQDNSVDSTSSLRDNAGLEDADIKTGRGEDCDALSINADTFDSDIEGASFEERSHDIPVVVPPIAASQPDELVMDIEKSVNEILGLAEPVVEKVQSAPVTVLPEDVQPSAQQLELLELEMRARAIKALMKAGEVKKS
ncbi:caspase activity and apoptosis inhibitor 1 isoform 1-T2 [Rhinophrynus dorsalis]